MDFRAELSKWGYNKGNAIDVEILINEILPSLFFPKEEPKQETLEESALKEAQLSYFGNEVDAYVRGSVFGAKWQQEQDKNKYSEEEAFFILCKHTAELLKGSKLTLTEWFEQFKNK